MASVIQVASIQSQTGTAVTFSNGLNVTPGYSINCASDVNIVGVLTATNFVGNGSALTNTPGITASLAAGLSLSI